MRSRTGCLTCRSRKLKCDEVKPICGQCRIKSRRCLPCASIVFRHHQNASMNDTGNERLTSEQDGTSHLARFYAYKDTFDEAQIWIDIPRNVTFIHISTPYSIDSTLESVSQSQTKAVTPNLDTNDVSCDPISWDDESFSDSISEAVVTALATPYEDIAVDQHREDPSEPSHDLFFHDLAFIDPVAADPSSQGETEFLLTNAVERSSCRVTPLLQAPNYQILSPSALSDQQRRENSCRPDINAIGEQHTALLLRHFSETIGTWMDVFDLGCYFSRHVPIQAVSSPLLLHAACACAAKQLGRVRGTHEAGRGFTGSYGWDNLHLGNEDTDWAWHGADHYDKAIKLLLGEISRLSDSIPGEYVGQDQERRATLLTEPSNSRPIQAAKRTISSANADEILTAAAILCTYEFLDNANGAFAKHLSGTKGLLDMLDEEGMMPLQTPLVLDATTIQRIRPSTARRSNFWTFARQDLFAAFINETQTRINAGSWSVWRAAGLPLDDRGLIAQSPDGVGLSSTDEDRCQDMISNALVWILSKVINFTASGDSIDTVFPQDPSSPASTLGINQMTLLECWRELERVLEVWFKRLPDSFKPCTRLEPLRKPDQPDDEHAGSLFPHVWFSMPMCAATMQTYYMTRILLLANRPQESTARRSTLGGRLHSYRSIEAEARSHSREICGIALGNTDASVRIHMIQPLFVAGQCLTEAPERRAVLNLLRDIEADLGWSTGYRVQQLNDEWAREEERI